MLLLLLLVYQIHACSRVASDRSRGSLMLRPLTLHFPVSHAKLRSQCVLSDRTHFYVVASTPEQRNEK